LSKSMRLPSISSIVSGWPLGILKIIGIYFFAFGLY
jgi:hypothetical protein